MASDPSDGPIVAGLNDLLASPHSEGAVADR
jgi:hypothetical protein